MDKNETYGPNNSNFTVIELNSNIDGKTIQIGLNRPVDPETGEPITDVPVILIATPYTGTVENHAPGYNCIPKGYAYAIVPIRGTGGSGGCWNAMGPAERRDIDQAISYLGNADWSNGNVGMIGISYDGSTPWQAAAMGNPYLKTIVPADGVTSLGGWANYRNREGEANPILYGGTAVYGGFESFFIGGPIFGTDLDTYASRATCQQEAVEGVYAQTYSHVTGEDTGGYWAARNFRPLIERNYEGSILISQGFDDYNVKADQIYPYAERLEADEDIEVRYVLGQWPHDWPHRSDWDEIVMDHFDRELQDEPAPNGKSSARGEPPSQTESGPNGPDAYVQDTTGEWRAEETWPPERAEPDTWYLQPNGTIARTTTTESGTRMVGLDTSTRRNGKTVPGCGACVVFETDRFDTAYRFAGQPRLNVTATPTGPGGHLTTHVYVVHDDGTSEHLTAGIVRLAYGDGGESADTIVPGQPVDVSVPVLPQDVKIPGGSKLVLVISQRDRQGGTIGLYPYPVEVKLGNGSATFDVRTFEATPDEIAMPPGANVNVTGDRSDDGDVFTGGQSNQIDVTVTADHDRKVRDTIPASWNVTAGEAVRVEQRGNVKRVYFGTVPADTTTTFTYFVEAPAGPTATGSYDFGPLQVRKPDRWVAVPTTGDTNYVIGPDRNNVDQE